MADDTDRPAALLTKAQRAYLRGDRDYSPSGEREVTVRMRKRVANAIEDFTLLFEYWDEEEREKVFTPSEDRERAFENGLVDLLALVYMEYGLSPSAFEDLIRRGVTRGEQRFAGSDEFHVDVDLTVERVAPYDLDLKKTADLIRRGKIDEVDERELRAFVKYYRLSNELEPEVPARHLEAQMQEYAEKHDDALARSARERREKQGRKEDMQQSDQ
jgi:hypothetical protein